MQAQQRPKCSAKETSASKQPPIPKTTVKANKKTTIANKRNAGQQNRKNTNYAFAQKAKQAAINYALQSPMRSNPQKNRSFLRLDATTIEENANSSIHRITSDSPSATLFCTITLAEPNVYMVTLEVSLPIPTEEPNFSSSRSIKKD